MWISAPKDYDTDAFTTEWISLKNWNRCTFLIKTGSVATGGAITLNEATDVNSAGSTALAFTKYFTNASTVTSPMLTEVAVSSNSFNIGTTNSATYCIEVTADQLTDGYDCINIAMAATGGTDFMDVCAILSEPRYAAAPASQPSSVID